jgi:HEAT repeat protein
VADRFHHAMRLMRSRDPQTSEDGFHLLLPHAASHIEALITEFSRESDHGLRCWLLELIGEARSPRALPLLVEQLNGDDEALRSRAARGLEHLDTKPARHHLYQARVNGLIP